MVGLSDDETIDRFKEAVLYIKGHPEITNVLISGGDPLILSTEVIHAFLDALKTVEHLDFIRFGTRVPVVFPQRIVEDHTLVKMLGEFADNFHQLYIVTHFNHPKELTEISELAISRLRHAGLVINNQTVLMKGVNDDSNTLAQLMSGLLRFGINPYYVFQCRPVKRVKQNFQLPLLEACTVVDEARTLLDGHGKRFKFVMSHESGKIEIIGIMGDDIYFKQHEARNPEDIGALFKRKLHPEAGWLDDLES